MVTVTIDEITLNATRAALDERAKRIERKVRHYTLTPDDVKYGVTLTEDGQRALVWNVAALLETEQAREFFSEVRLTDHPVDATWTSA